MRKFFCIMLIFCMVMSYVPTLAAVDEYTFTPFKITVVGNGSFSGNKRLLIYASTLGFDITKENQLAGCKLNGTITYSGSTEGYSKSIPLNDVLVAASPLRTDGKVSLDFKVPEGYAMEMTNLEASSYSYDLTLSPKEPEVVVDEYNFTPFNIKVTNTGGGSGTKRLVLKTDNFPFAVTEINQLKDCKLNGTVTYSGTNSEYSPSIPFSDVKIVTNDVRENGAKTAIDFVVPDGYTICQSNSEDSNYTWDLTISPKPAPTNDIPKTGSTFFITPDMFKISGNWNLTTADGYQVLHSGSSTQIGGTAYANMVIPADGTYKICSLVRDYATNNPGSRYMKSAVNGIALNDAGKHGEDGFKWEVLGEVSFSKGDIAKYTMLETSAPYARIAAIMFTTEDYIPSDDLLTETLKAGKGEVYPVDETRTNLVFLPDDFATDMGGWTTTSFNGIKCLYGRTTGTVPTEVTANVNIPHDGTYYVWGLAADYTSNAQGSRHTVIGINGSYLEGKVGIHGATHDTGAGGALGWDKAGKVTLKKGTITLSAKDINAHTRLGAIMLTTDENFQGFSNSLASEIFSKYRGTVNTGYDIAMLSSYGNKLSYTFKNRTGNALSDAVLMSAIYSEEGRLEDVLFNKFSVDANKSLEKTSLIFNPSNKWKYGKVMLWSSMESMKPLAISEFTFTEEDYANPDDGMDIDFGTVTSYMPNYTVVNDYYAPEYYTRGGIYNTLKKLEDGEDITIGYLGGSITQQDSWRPYTTKWFEEKYSGNVTEVSIGLSGTGADLAVCRIDREILVHNPDLVFIEYASNGGEKQDMEGMVLKIREHDPTTDIIFVYTTPTSNYNTYKSGNVQSFAKEFDVVAEHYDIPSVFFGIQAFDLYDQDKLVLSGTKQDGKILYTQDGIHLTGDGGFLAAGAIGRCVNKMYDTFDKETYTEVSYTNPATTCVATPWKNADYTSDWSKMKFEGTWLDCSLDSNNDFKNFSYTGGYLTDFKKMFPNMTGTKVAGSSVTIKFKGTDIGVFEAGGQFSGQLKVTVDGKDLTNKLVLYNNYDSKLRHQYYFIPTLEDGVHEVTFTLDSEMPDKSYLQGKNPTDTLYERNEFYLGRILFVGELLDINE